MRGSRGGTGGVKIRSSDKDQLIAELRQQLYDLKNQERDYRGVNDEIFSMENRYKLLSEEKVRSEMEGRARLDRGMDEIAECRKQIEDLKYMLSEKSRQNMELQDEQGRSKRVLDEKFFEAGKNRDESNAKGDNCVDLRSQTAELERDIDLVKSQRADMFREITRLRDVQDMKTRESLDQTERAKALEFDLQKTLQRIDDQNRTVEARSYDISQKSTSLTDTEREISRVKDMNSQQNVEIVALRRDVDRVNGDCYDLRKNIEGLEGKNGDHTSNIRGAEIRIKEKEDTHFGVKKDIENQNFTNSNMRGDLNDYMAEKEAMERHSRILLGQNDDLTKELERFVNTDEVLRQQLDRRARIMSMQDKNNQEIGYSNMKVTEARERSPQRQTYQPRREEPRREEPRREEPRREEPRREEPRREESPPRQSSFKPRGGSPLRSTYKQQQQSYNY